MVCPVGPQSAKALQRSTRIILPPLAQISAAKMQQHGGVFGRQFRSLGKRLFGVSKSIKVDVRLAETVENERVVRVSGGGKLQIGQSV